MTIYSAVTGKSFDEIGAASLPVQGYGAFKPAVGEAVVETAAPHPRGSRRAFWRDKAYLESVYQATGAQKASYVAEKTLRKVYKKVGFVAQLIKEWRT